MSLNRVRAVSACSVVPGVVVFEMEEVEESTHKYIINLGHISLDAQS